MDAAHMGQVLTRVASGLAVAAVLIAAPAQAQLSGALSGRVVDHASGEPLRGATVTATGPGLRGPQRAKSDDDGEFFLPLLPPGPVDLDVQRFGYQALSVSAVSIPLGETVRLRIELFPETGQLAFTTAPQPGVIPQGAAAESTISRQQLALVPYGRDLRSFDAGFAAFPGVQRGGTINGAASAEHSVRIDGAPVNGAFGLGTPLLQDFIEEIEIKRAGYRAEDGGGAGAVLQAATRSGGEALHGSLFSNVSPWEAPRRSGPSRGADVDFGGEMGGPLVRDRLYFYGGFAPVFLSGQKQFQFVGKLDWAPTASQRLSAEAFGNPGDDSSSRDALVRYDGALGDRTLLVQAVASWHRDDGPPTYAYQADRLAGDLRLTSLVGVHELKAGLQAWRQDGVDSSVAVFAQDAVRLLDGVLLDTGLRYERDQRAATRYFLPRLGLSWDFRGGGTSRAFVSWGRTTNATALVPPGPSIANGVSFGPSLGIADQVTAGVESQVFRDLVAGAVYEHAVLDARRFDAVTLLVRKPFGENYLLSGSYTLSRLRGGSPADDAPNVFKLDLAYLYELDARTSVSLGAAVRLFDLATALVNEIDLRLSGTRRLNQSLSASLTLDLFNLTDSRAPLPTIFYGAGGTCCLGSGENQLPFTLRGGAALSF
jgi:hypothetical protein